MNRNNTPDNSPDRTPADICLITEGAYPFTTGGLAGWAHQLLKGLPDLSFEVVTLVAGSAPRVPCYELPPNVRKLHTIDIHGPRKVDPARRPGFPALGRAWANRPSSAARTAELARQLLEGPASDRAAIVARVIDSLGAPDLGAEDLLRSRAAWDLLVTSYRQYADHLSFPDYYWTWRSLLVPLIGLVRAQLPPATVYHAASTGYGGLLAALASRRTGSRMALTEHGIYSREREIDLARAEWVYVEPGQGSPLTPRRFYFRELWAAYFDLLSQIAYDKADLILTLNDVNRQLQVRAGAPADLIRRVPNGVDISRFEALRREHDWTGRPFRVAFIGRIVPVKDVKTFLRAIALARMEVPDLEAFVIGPHDEAPDYSRECRDLAEFLGLGDVLRFTGPADIRRHLAELDVVVLTSLSESQPLAVLEAYAAGVPCICSDVGGCRELVEGTADPADRELGPSGIVTRAARPADTAQAIVDLRNDPALHARLREAAIARVTRFYDERTLLASYRRVYAGLEPFPEGGAVSPANGTANGALT